MEDSGILEAVELMQVSKDLAVYRQTLAYAPGNLSIMILIASSLIIVQSFIGSYPILLIVWIGISILAVLVHIYVFRQVLRRISLGISIYSYPIILVSGYLVNIILTSPVPLDFLWYPLLGICNTLVGLTAETAYYKKNKLFSRPLLINGLLLLVSAPIILIILTSIITEPNVFIALGFALIITSLTTSYAMGLAEKRVVNK